MKYICVTLKGDQKDLIPDNGTHFMSTELKLNEAIILAYQLPLENHSLKKQTSRILLITSCELGTAFTHSEPQCDTSGNCQLSHK